MKRLILFFLTLVCVHLMAQTPDFSISGFATYNGGTSGGTGGTAVTVSNYADLKKYAEEVDTKYIISISGTIKGTGTVADKNYQGSIKVKSNKTILGIGSTAFLDGVGFSISGVKNIIIRNVKFNFTSIGKAIPAGSGDIAGIYSALGDEGRPQILVNSGDLISISGSNNNIWIDHCEFFEEDPAVQKNIDLYDGLIDIKNDSRYITISWCYFHDHHKCSLIGSADTDLFPERKVTLHHNYYIRVGSRLPLIRGGVAHFFNNYVNGASSVSNSRMGACVKSEKNYFENSKSVVLSSGSTAVGFAEVVDNKMVNSTTSTLDPCTPSLPYNYTAVLTSDPNNVKTVVTTYAGVGKLVTGLDEERAVAGNFSLTSFPNPCKGHAFIAFNLLQNAQVELHISDLIGSKIVPVVHENLSAGQHQFEVNVKDLPTGLYIYSLKVNGKITSKRLIVQND